LPLDRLIHIILGESETAKGLTKSGLHYFKAFEEYYKAGKIADVFISGTTTALRNLDEIKDAIKAGKDIKYVDQTVKSKALAEGLSESQAITKATANQKSYFNIDASVADILKVLTDSSGWVIESGNLFKKTVQVGSVTQTVKVAIKELDTKNPVYNLTKIITAYGKY
jgi:glycerol-3-phosphate dehydrogenase